MAHTYIRPIAMIRRDLSPVLAIESRVYENYAWNRRDFELALQQDCTGIIAESADESVIGYAIYETGTEIVSVLNVTVDVGWRRRGIGAALLRAVRNRACGRQVLLHLRETNLAAQLFLREQGFLAVAVVHDYYDGLDEDAIVFRYGGTKSECDGDRQSGKRNRRT